MSAYCEKLKKAGIEYRLNEPSAAHVTMKAGGALSIFVLPKNVSELIFAFNEAKKENIKPFILGNGSNTVFSDNGFNGAVIGTELICNIMVTEEKIEADCGAILSKVASLAADNSLAGMEFAHGIPGSLGGAVFMNAGAYGGEMKDIIESVTFFDGEKITVKNANELFFDYRESEFSKNGAIVLSVKLKLQKGKKTEIKAKMKELLKKRKEKQPLNYPSSGSTFKRPEGYFAGKLIEDAGLKGKRIGNMAVSEKHAGFVVNLGGGTETDLEKLISEVQETVREKFKVELEPEIRIIK